MRELFRYNSQKIMIGFKLQVSPEMLDWTNLYELYCDISEGTISEVIDSF